MKAKPNHGSRAARRLRVESLEGRRLLSDMTGFSDAPGPRPPIPAEVATGFVHVAAPAGPWALLAGPGGALRPELGGLPSSLMHAEPRPEFPYGSGSLGALYGPVAGALPVGRDPGRLVSPEPGRAVVLAMLKTAEYRFADGSDLGGFDRLLGPMGSSVTINAAALFPSSEAQIALLGPFGRSLEPFLNTAHVFVPGDRPFREVGGVGAFNDVLANSGPLAPSGAQSPLFHEAIANPVEVSSGARLPAGSGTVPQLAPMGPVLAAAGGLERRGPIIEDGAQVPTPAHEPGGATPRRGDSQGRSDGAGAGSDHRLPPDPAAAGGGVLVSSPREADLLTQFLPFDRASLEIAIDQFLDHVEGLGDELARLDASLAVLPSALVFVAAVTAAGFALRLRREGEADELGAASGGHARGASVPGLPRSWSSE